MFAFASKQALSVSGSLAVFPLRAPCSPGCKVFAGGCTCMGESLRVIEKSFEGYVGVFEVSLEFKSSLRY